MDGDAYYKIDGEESTISEDEAREQGLSHSIIQKNYGE
jgi:hypothetical protein